MIHLLRAASVAAFLLTPAVGWAGLTLCNQTAVTQTIAIGHKSGDNWISRGWWNIEPGGCATPVGDDLRYRYYYYYAEAKGRTFADEDYGFCTQRSAFAITGDEDCVARGYEQSKFRRIDTGEKNTSFTLTLVESENQAAPTPSPSPAPRSVDPAPPGTFGEPYFSGSAYLQGCFSDANGRQCSFHSDGTKFFVYDDGRTASVAFDVMTNLLPGTPITVQGDLESIYDATADVVLRDVTVRQWTNHDGIMNRLQGTWYSVSDPKSMFNILGAERENTYDGQVTGLDFINVQGWCDHYSDNTYLYAREPETQENFCYQIIDVSDWTMTLMYLPGGNYLEYRKLD